MAGEVQTIRIGGVEYDKNEVANQYSVTKERTTSKGLCEQYKEYNVTLKDGTKLTYEQQTEHRKATIDIVDDGSINFFGLSGAKIIGTDGNDNYRLHGCENTNVNVLGDSKNSMLGSLFGKERKFDEVHGYKRTMPDGSIQKSYMNRAIGDEDDKISRYTF